MFVIAKNDTSVPLHAIPSVLSSHGRGEPLGRAQRISACSPLMQGGRCLPEGLRLVLEAFFRADFSGVRTHVGAEAPTIGALACTMGSHVFFAPGQFDPCSPGGLRLLVHELVHVLQQRAGRVPNPFSSGVALVDCPVMEKEATQLASRLLDWVLAGRSVDRLPTWQGPRCADPQFSTVVQANRAFYDEIKGIVGTIQNERHVAKPEVVSDAATAFLTMVYGTFQAKQLDEHSLENGDLKTKLDALTAAYFDQRLAFVQQEFKRIKGDFAKSVVEIRFQKAKPKIGAAEAELKKLALFSAAQKTFKDRGPARLKTGLTTLKKPLDDSEKNVALLPQQGWVPLIPSAKAAWKGPVALDERAIKEISTVASTKQGEASINSIFKGTADGRTGPDPNFRHIHVGGNATENLIYSFKTGTVLGTVDFHIESSMTQGQKTQVANVERRAQSQTFLAFIHNNQLHEVI